jgi:hypothetical protein
MAQKSEQPFGCASNVLVAPPGMVRVSGHLRDSFLASPMSAQAVAFYRGRKSLPIDKYKSFLAFARHLLHQDGHRAQPLPLGASFMSLKWYNSGQAHSGLTARLVSPVEHH